MQQQSFRIYLIFRTSGGKDKSDRYVNTDVHNFEVHEIAHLEKDKEAKLHVTLCYCQLNP